MRCIFPTCNNDTKRGFLQGIALYRFPEEESLRTAWLEALGKADWQLEADSAVCSKHFLTEDFLVTRRGRKLRADAVPIDIVEVCRICFARDCKLYPMKDDMQLDLSRPSYALAYETLTGFLIEEDDKLPPYLCIQCANLLLNCVRFRAKCIRAHSILVEIINDYGYVTMESIVSVNTNPNLLSSVMTHIHTDSGHIETENTYITEQYLKEEDITIDGIKTESDQVFEHNILITDVRSTSDNRISPNLEDDFIVNQAKEEHVSLVNKQRQTNEDVPDTDTVCLPRSHVDNADGHVETEKNDVINNDNVNEESNNDNGEDVFVGENSVVNGSLPSEKTRENDKLSPPGVKVTVPKDLNQTTVQRNWKPEGLLLSFKLLSCDICKYQTVSEVKLMNHIKAHAAIKLQNCDFLTSSEQNLQLHYEKHSDKKYSCDFCSKTFTYKHDLKDHLRIHTGEKPYSCDICNNNFRQNNQLKAHLRTHTNEKPYLCRVCKKAFRQKGHLQSHLRIHSGERPYTCDVCSKAFNQRGQLQNHLQRHYNDKSQSCDMCAKKISFNNLKAHLRTHTNEKPYPCNVCKKAFRQRGQLQSHLRIHSDKKQYRCGGNKSFIRKSQLEKKILQRHRKGKSWRV